jgi:hypothetical protein
VRAFRVPGTLCVAGWLAWVGCSTPPGGTDGGQRDSGAATDSGMADSGTASDAGRSADAGALDSGSSGPDAGTPGDAGSAAVSPYACGAATTAAVFVTEVPPPATLQPYQVVQTAVTFANCGTQTWTATAAGAPTGFKLGFDAPRDDDTWGAGRVALPADVPVGFQVTVPLTVRATPLTGPHSYAWAIVDEGVAWLAAPSPTHSIDVEASALMATLCSGVQADIGGGASASAQVQQCIDATPSGGTLELPAGVYRVTSPIQLDQPITLRTQGTAGVGAGCLDANGPACAVLRADEALNPTTRGFFLFGATNDVAVDHIVIDGNRALRLGGGAAAACAGGNNGPGINAGTTGCTGCSLHFGVSARAVCGSGWEWGSGDNALIANSVFRENGDHYTQNMWSDGLTVNRSNGATIQGNRMIDNSDVDLIYGGGTNATVQGNSIVHLAQASFAGLMLDNFNGTTSGDFTASQVTGNSVSCGAQLCDFAIELGPHPWYVSANLIGGTVSGNTAAGGKFNINAEGAGTAASPMIITGNTTGPAPANATFNCGSRASTSFNVSPDSNVSLQAGPQPTASIQFHLCP